MRRTGAAIVMAWLAAGSAAATDLSPGRWPAEERARLERLEASLYPSAARSIEGGQAVVSATASPIAVHAGLDALRQGGTAADAAVAVALTQVATSLGSVVSYAGVAELVYFDARSGRTYAMDAGWTPYAGETDPASIPAMDTSLITGGGGVSAPADRPGRKTLVPGFMAGMAAMNGRFGRLPLRELLQPAIWYADHGVPATPLLMSYLGMRRGALGRTAEGRAFLAGAADGRPKLGQRLAQPQVAQLLRGVARDGADYMYRGPWARRYVEVVRREGGAVTAADLARYRAVWETPLSTAYAGATVTGPGAANAGGCAVLAVLNLLDAQRTPDAPAYWRDAAVFAAYARAIRYEIAANFTPAIGAYERSVGQSGDCAGRLTPSYGRAMAPRIPALLAAARGSAGSHSASVVVVDRWGNVAALVHSINAVIWGDTGIVVDGVPLSDAAGLQRGRLAGLKPGQHVPGGMAPVIAFRDGRPVAAVASVGSSLEGETARVMAGLLDGRDPAELAAAPPLISPYLTPGDMGAEPVPAGAYPPAFRVALTGLGLRLRDEPPVRIATLRGTVAAAQIAEGGARRAVEVPGVLVFGEAR